MLEYQARDLPERFGDFRVIHTRHSRWSKSGVWQRVFQVLAEDADNEYGMIDATIVRAHQRARKRSKKMIQTKLACRSKGGLSTKIHTLCDALGNPTGFYLTESQVHDLEGADVLLENIQADALLADKAYDAYLSCSQTPRSPTM